MNDQPTPFDDAELYDRIFAELDYGLDFYLAEAAGAGGPVLDLACGTGRILLPLLRAGVDADGADGFAPMLERARLKCAAEGYSPTLAHVEMPELRMPRRYALIVIPFNSFVHNLTADDQVATLRACREHLLPGSKLVFDIFFPGPEYLSQPQDVPALEGETLDPETGRTLQMFDLRTLDLVEQRQHSANEVRELAPGGEVLASHRFETTIRWATKTEMELLLRLAGFARWEIARGFDRAPLSGAAEPLLVSAWA